MHLFETQGDWNRAESLYKDAITVKPGAVQPHYNLAGLYWKQSRWRDVIHEFESVLKIEPSHPDARKYLESARKKIL